MKFKGVIILFSLLFLFFSVFQTKSFAQEKNSQSQVENPYVPQNFNSSNTAPNVPKNLHTYTQSVVIEVLSAISCQLSGMDPMRPGEKCLGVDRNGKIAYVQNSDGGGIGLMGRLIGWTFNIPVSTGEYTHMIASNFGIAKQAQAQGIGFDGLRPVLKIWTAFRNVVYLFFVFIFILIGLGIMFRIKIDPRTVMTIQNQIPKAIIALILVTFSYAIAGLLIDLMYIVIYLFFNIIQSVVNTPQPNIAQNPFSFVNKLYAPDIPVIGDQLGIMSIVFGASKSVGALIASLFVDFFDSVIGGLFKGALSFFNIGCNIPGVSDIPGLGWLDKVPGAGIIPGISGGLPGLPCFENQIRTIVGGIVGVLAFFIILYVVFKSLFRLWFILIKSYIFILFDVIFAPIWIAAGLIPGSPVGFGQWIRDLIANLAAFPAVIVMFMIGKALMDGFDSSNTSFAPPLLGSSGNSASPFSALIGLGIILSAPSVVEKVKEVLKAPKPSLKGASEPITVFGRATSGAGSATWANLNKRDQMGEPKGEIATVMDTRVKPRVLRSIFGLNPDIPEKRRQAAADAKALDAEKLGNTIATALKKTT